jgi:hypothetical protein
MFKPVQIAVALLLIAACLSPGLASAEWRVRIKTLGGTPSAFSTPLNEPDDLRRMIGANLADVTTVLQQPGTRWSGRIQDLARAAQIGKIQIYALDTGKRIPWMAMRKNGRPTIYKPKSGMIWDGLAPLEAYSILFESNHKAWTLIVPKPCGNLWITAEPLTEMIRKQIASDLADLDCFHEKQEIQFAPSPSPYNRDGLIMHDNSDFGDTAQREGWYWLGVWIRQNEIHQPWSDSPPRILVSFDAVERKLEPDQNGIFVRAPGKDPFGRATPGDGHENHCMTRDQLVPLVAALSVWGKRDALQRLWYALPEDTLGKHDFQGHWHDLLTGLDSYTADPVNDIRNRDCSSGRHCDPQQDTRPCGFDVDLGWFGKHHLNDPVCEIAKAAQNALYAAQKIGCEALKAAEQAACEVQKGLDIAFAVVKKELYILHFTGDPLQPVTYTFLVRAGVLPLSIYPVTIWETSIKGLISGEIELVGAMDVLRSQATGHLACGSQATPDALDCVDQDMNSIVMLWMSRHTFPTPLTWSAIESYKSRAHSYGSYFGSYCAIYGPLTLYPAGQCPVWEPDCCPDKLCLNAKLTERMKAGIKSGWPPDARGIGPYGAVRWYNRWTTGANPRLAILWQPIIDDLLK